MFFITSFYFILIYKNARAVEFVSLLTRRHFKVKLVKLVYTTEVLIRLRRLIYRRLFREIQHVLQYE